MTKTKLFKALAIGGIAACTLQFACVRPNVHAAETRPASGHLCGDCLTCPPVLVPHHRPVERGCIDHLHRSGHPETQGRFAKPSLNQHYSFGYVGGGGAFRGEPRSADEGTWGVDYSGILIKKHIWLPWLHGHHAPRHDGSYRTDGPQLLER